MKKVFTLIAAALLSVSTYAVDDLTLDLGAITSGWSGGYDTANSQIKFGGWDSAGWEFFPGVSTAEYSGIALTLSEATTVPLEIKYEDDKTQTIASIGTSETITFSESGTVVSIKFANGGDGGTVKLTVATLKGIASATAAKPTANLALPFDKIKGPGWGVTTDTDAKTITIDQYSNAGWNVVPGVSTDNYSGIKFTLTQAPVKGGAILVKYRGWSGAEGADNSAVEDTFEVTGTTVEANFTKTGVVTNILFKGDGWHDTANGDENLGKLTYGIGDCFLVVKSTETGISTATVANQQADDAIYTLGGQRVTKAQKGIYIVGGKKIVVK